MYAYSKTVAMPFQEAIAAIKAALGEQGFGVLAEIDVQDDGSVFITTPDGEGARIALQMIEQLTREPKVGDIFLGRVVRIMPYGAFVNILPNRDGMVHISELANERVKNVTDVVKEGDVIKVKVIDIDNRGRIRLSRKAALSEGEA